MTQILFEIKLVLDLIVNLLFSSRMARPDSRGIFRALGRFWARLCPPLSPKSHLVAAFFLCGGTLPVIGHGQPLPIDHLAEVGLTVSDLSRTRAFYSQVLGFAPESPAADPAARFRVNAIQAIAVSPGLKPSDRFSLTYVAFWTSDAAGLRGRLAELGLHPGELQTGPEGRIGFALPPPAVQINGRIYFMQGPPNRTEADAASPVHPLSRHLEHVGVPVRAFPAAYHFYHDLLGFRDRYRRLAANGRDVVIDQLWLPNSSTDFIELSNLGSAAGRLSRGSAHFALEVADAAEAGRQAAQRGCPPRNAPRFGWDNRYNVSIIDPDGSRVEFMQSVDPLRPTPLLITTPLEEEILYSGSGWRLVAQGYGVTDGPATAADGTCFWNDAPAGKIYTWDPAGSSPPRLWLADGHRHSGQAFGPDGRLYGWSDRDTLAVFTPAGVQPIARGFIRGNDLVAARNGNLYLTTDPPFDRPTEPSHVWLVRPDGASQIVDSGLSFANGLALSPDQALLYVDDSKSPWLYRYEIAPDGTLRGKERFTQLRVAADAADCQADGLRVDRQGRIYVATRLGIQILEATGQVAAILPLPDGRVSNLTFAGRRFDQLVATCRDRIYARPVKVSGANEP